MKILNTKSVLALAAAFLIAGAAAASGAQRMPVIGCQNLYRVGSNTYPWSYAPSGYCTPLNTLQGISNAKWIGWGAAQSTATGQYVDGRGFVYPATITAYDLVKAKNYVKRGSTVTYYHKLHVVAQAAVYGGFRYGPFDLTLADTPSRTLLCGRLAHDDDGFDIRSTLMTCGGAKSVAREWDRKTSCHPAYQYGTPASRKCRIDGFSYHAHNTAAELTEVDAAKGEQKVVFQVILQP